MNVLILGANGKVGSRVARRLIERGHTVVAAIHTRQDQVPEQAKIIKIDMQNPDSLEGVLQDVDVVVSALSSWKSPGHSVLNGTMKTLIPAMEQTGVGRIISIAGDVVLMPNEKPALLVRIIRGLAFGVVRKVIKDSEAHLHALHASSLDWTVLRPAVMSRALNAKYELQTTHPSEPFIPRAAVAEAIVDLVENDEWRRTAPFIRSK